MRAEDRTKLSPNNDWFRARCISIWISGSKTSLMSAAEIWQIVFCWPVIALSTVIGLTAGAAASAALYWIGDLYWAVTLLLAGAPMVVNISSSMLMTAMMRLRFAWSGKTDEVISVPSVVTVFFSVILFVCPIFVFKPDGGVDLFSSLWTKLFVVTGTYLFISEVVHFLVFAYIAPFVWGRDHIYGHHGSGSDTAESTEKGRPDTLQPSASPVDLGEVTITAR